ncbi:unnamed protein product (macronuclear) [Paramecium tetraurelia]|uniref:RING-type domain-containing protein n=1 Tax=Paramecium tetraurelia TaxID=5888 RepID=A0DM62_PARTE|nr:uncharacterized protein GSPATT00018347001 [Paramecium tetraurelia]CAK84129.1 unnamed protein product [Paramecium tetraurelia]|eukprot:XP_001451526.1 hypothetical protein (macronuclear) [Paramecium tetraurelia strain d4-2]
MDLLIDNVIKQIEEFVDAKLQKLQQKIYQKIELQDAMIKFILENFNALKESQQTMEPKSHRTKHSVSQSLQILKILNTCSVCNLDIIETSEEIETNCHHFYHEKCLQKKVKQQIEMGFITGNCVGRLSNTNRLCYGKIRIQDCKFVDQSKLTNINLNHQALKLMGQFTTCPMHDCNYFFRLNENIESKINFCNNCNKCFCYNCLEFCQKQHKCQSTRKFSQIICKLCNKCGILQIIQKMKPQLACTQCQNMIFL